MSIEYAIPLGRRVHVPARLLRLMPDERLVEQLHRGNELAFAVLFDRHQRGVLAFCRHMLGSPYDAEDAAQHTFLAAYRGILRSREPIALRPWLFTIARNRCLSVLRARRDCPVDEVPATGVGDPAADAETRDELRALLLDVGRLPVDQRAALVLTELGGFSHADIAQILGCRREKVKALVFQGRSSLIAGRDARETPCSEIRAQLAAGRGGDLRRINLRRHLRDCAGCREFSHAVGHQRRRLAALLPIPPSVGLEQAVLAGTIGAGGTTATGAAVGAGLLGGLAAKTLIVVAVAAGGGLAAAVTVAGREAGAPAATGDPAQAERDPRVHGSPGLGSAAGDRDVGRAGPFSAAVADPGAPGGLRSEAPPAARGEQHSQGSSPAAPASGAAGTDEARPAAGDEPAPPAGDPGPAGSGSERGGPGRPGSDPPADGRRSDPPARGGRSDPRARGRRSDPPARGGRSDPRARGRRSDPPAHGRRADPPAPGRRSQPPSHGRRAAPPAGRRRPDTPGRRPAAPAEGRGPSTPAGPRAQRPASPSEPAGARGQQAPGAGTHGPPPKEHGPAGGGAPAPQGAGKPPGNGPPASAPGERPSGPPAGAGPSAAPDVPAGTAKGHGNPGA